MYWNLMCGGMWYYGNDQKKTNIRKEGNPYVNMYVCTYVHYVIYLGYIYVAIG